jgi:pyrimidine deaminase RibD-like protein
MNSEFMREALDLARQGRSMASPNPMVGAVLVRDGEVVGSMRKSSPWRKPPAGRAALLSMSAWNPARIMAARRPARWR